MKVHTSAENQQIKAKCSTCLGRESAQESQVQYILQQRISRLKPNAVHVSAENQQREDTSNAHLYYTITEARNLLRPFCKAYFNT
jgi:hypothetical protein